MPATSSRLAPPIETATEAVPGTNSASGSASRVSVPPPASATRLRRRHRLAGRPDAERELLRQDVAVRRRRVDVDRVVADDLAGDRHDETAARAFSSSVTVRSRSARRDADAVAGGDGQRVVAGRAGDIVDLDEQARGVAGAQEPRKAGGDDHRIAHQHVLDGVADAALRPGHRHHPYRAVEFGHVERHGRLAVGADLDDARVEGDQLLGRRRRGEPHRPAVAAGADLARHALHAVDQQAVEVADLHAELALAEIPVVRRRRLEAGEVEDADIDGGDGDVGLRARRRDCRWRPESSSAWRGRISSATSSATSRSRSPGSTLAQVRPSARAGMRLAGTSIGR